MNVHYTTPAGVLSPPLTVVEEGGEGLNVDVGSNEVGLSNIGPAPGDGLTTGKV